MQSKLSGTGCAGRESELWVRGAPTPLPPGKLLGGNSEQKEPQCLMCNPLRCTTLPPSLPGELQRLQGPRQWLSSCLQSFASPEAEITTN